MKLPAIALTLALSALGLGQLSQTSFLSRVKDGHHEPSKVERFTGTEPVKLYGDQVLSNVETTFPLWIYGGHVQLSNVKVPSIILSQVSGDLERMRFGAGDIALSLIRCNDLTITNSRFAGPNRIALQSMPGEAWSFEDTALRSGLNWKPENVWKHGTNLAGQGPIGIDPVVLGNGTNRVRIAAPAFPAPGWFQYSTPRAKDAVVQVHGLPDGMVRWVDENTLEMVGGTFEIGRQYRFNSYHPEFLSRNITIEDNVFDGYSLAGINTFFTQSLLILNNRFYVRVTDDGTILPEESWETRLQNNIRVPRDPRPNVPAWDARSIGFIGTMVNATVKDNENLPVNAQHRNRPAYGFVSDSPLRWVGGESPWVTHLSTLNGSARLE
jgi:hypothetical protein